MGTEYASAVAAVRAMECSLLSPADIEQLISADSAEEDVYALTKAIFDNIDAITAENAKGAELSLENATSGMTVPFHKGAAKYFAEKGIEVSAE